jgi:hypothetical protein
MAHSGLFEQARDTSAIGGEADIARNGSHALGVFRLQREFHVRFAPLHGFEWLERSNYKITKFAALPVMDRPSRPFAGL